jgi:ribosomal protein L11 methylase PrmA
MLPQINLILNGFGSVELVEGDITSVHGNYDMIAANCISGSLVNLAGEIALRLRTPGIAILFGILAGQDDEVAAAMEQAGLTSCERLREGKRVSPARRP